MSSCSSSATHPSGRAACCSASPISSGCRRTRRAQRSGLTFGCALNLLPSLLFPFVVLMVDDDGYGLRCGCVACCGITILGTQIGGSGTEGQDEYMGASLLFPSPSPLGSPSAHCCLEAGKGQTLRRSLRFPWCDTVGHCRPRTFPHYHGIILPRCAGRHTRYECSPLSRNLSHRDLGPCSLTLAHS
jgi:hypothetical protein